MLKKNPVFLYLLFSAFFSCRSVSDTKIKTAGENTEKISGNPKEKNIGQPSSGNASSQARIIATIIKIDESRDSSDSKSPCFKAPCMANIRIEKFERKGSLFHIPESNEITAFFIYTLHATNEDLFPNLGKWYPGLKINDKFEAIIESRPSIAEGNRFIIYEYKKIE